MVRYALRPGLSEMEDTHMEQRGTKSGERQRMRNLLLSRDRLARTLAADFTGGDLLATLTYQAGPWPRSRELARQQVRQCYIHRAIRPRMPQHIGRFLAPVEYYTVYKAPRLLRSQQINILGSHALGPSERRYAADPLLGLSQQGQALASELLRQPLQAGHSPLPCARLWVSSRGIHHT